MRVQHQMLWQTTDGKRDLLLLDRASGKIQVRAFELTPEELPELIAAVHDCHRALGAATPAGAANNGGAPC